MGLRPTTVTVIVKFTSGFIIYLRYVRYLWHSIPNARVTQPRFHSLWLGEWDRVINMAYESTEVVVSKSQEQIRHMIYSHKGTGVIIVSQRPREGFEALVTIADMAYHIRVMATCKNIPERNSYGQRRSQTQLDQSRMAEERRVWRVLYWHLKAMFEAADSGVIDIRDVIMPYVVTRDGRTLSEHLIPRMTEIMSGDPSRLLTSGG